MIVAQVGPGTPAAQAGLREGDIIVGFGDQEIKNDQQLRQAILARKPGDQVAVTVVRNGQRQQLQLKLGERPRGRLGPQWQARAVPAFPPVSKLCPQAQERTAFGL